MQKITYTLTYNDPIPTAASMRFNYGNGVTSADEGFPISVTGGSVTREYTYNEPGHYSTTLTVFNKVSSVTKTTMVRILMAYQNVHKSSLHSRMYFLKIYFVF